MHTIVEPEGTVGLSLYCKKPTGRVVTARPGNRAKPGESGDEPAETLFPHRARILGQEFSTAFSIGDRDGKEAWPAVLYFVAILPVCDGLSRPGLAEHLTSLLTEYSDSQPNFFSLYIPGAHLWSPALLVLASVELDSGARERALARGFAGCADCGCRRIVCRAV